MEKNVLGTYALAAKADLAAGYKFGNRSGKEYVEALFRITTPNKLDMVGISHTNAPGEDVKGHFMSTTYPDRLENGTECGYAAIAQRIMRNLARMTE